jgi:hypothetical protein
MTDLESGTQEATPMSAPSTPPPRRNPADVAPADSYRPTDPVWVYRDGWHAGVIETASARAVTVTYRPGPHRGTGVDTFTAECVLTRAESDPVLDRELAGLRHADGERS